MKKISLADYNPTEEEIRQVFEGRWHYEDFLEYLTQYQDWDSEKRYIAHLLFLRGDREGARKMLESMEKGPTLEDKIAYRTWEDKAEGIEWVY